MSGRVFRIETDYFEDWGSIWDPPPEFKKYSKSLTHYFIDDKSVTEAEYKAAVQEELTS